MAQEGETAKLRLQRLLKVGGGDVRHPLKLKWQLKKVQQQNLVIIMNFYISSKAPAFEKCTEKLPKFPKRYTKKRKKKNDFGARLKNGSSRKAATLDDVTMTNCLVAANSFGHNWLMWTCTDVIGWLMTRWQISLDVTSPSLDHPSLSGKTPLRQECSVCFNEVFCFVPHPTINIGLKSKEWWDGLLNVVFSFMGGTWIMEGIKLQKYIRALRVVFTGLWNEMYLISLIRCSWCKSAVVYNSSEMAFQTVGPACKCHYLPVDE